MLRSCLSGQRAVGERGVNPTGFPKNDFSGHMEPNRGLELWVVEGVGDPGQELEVLSCGGADGGEQGVNWLFIESAEIDRLLQETQSHHRPGHVEHDWVADVRESDPTADPSRSRVLAGKDQTQEQTPVDVSRHRQNLYHRRQCSVAARVAQPVEDPASFESFRETRGRLLIVIEPVEQVSPDFHAICGRPLKKFGAVKPVLPGDVTGGQTALPNPADHGGLRDSQRLAHVSHTELHRLLSCKLVGRPCS
jgi:hypothetical protein